MRRLSMAIWRYAGEADRLEERLLVVARSEQSSKRSSKGIDSTEAKWHGVKNRVTRIHARFGVTNSREGTVSEHGYTVIYEPLLEGGFQIIVPALPGVVSYGRTLDEAREMAHDAIRVHLKGLLKDGEDIPDDPFASTQPIAEELRVSV